MTVKKKTLTWYMKTQACIGDDVMVKVPGKCLYKSPRITTPDYGPYAAEIVDINTKRRTLTIKWLDGPRAAPGHKHRLKKIPPHYVIQLAPR